MMFTHREVADGNWHAGRTRPVDMIVVHVTEGTAASTRNWFADQAAGVSAHYMVCKDGTVDQFVDEQDVAYHAGRVLEPKAALVLERPGVNPNSYSIGVEHEGSGHGPLTPAQQESSIELIRGICARHGIPVTRRHIVGHREVYSAKSCPGMIDVDALVRALAAEPARLPKPTLVWSDHFKDWLIVTRVVSDTEWYFVRVAELRGRGSRAETPFSQMPR